MNERMPKFEAVPDSDKGYGETIRRVADMEPNEPMPDFTVGHVLESSNDEKFESLETEAKFKVIEGSDIGYGPSIERVKNEVTQNSETEDELNLTLDEGSIKQILNEKAEVYGFDLDSFALSEKQRKQLRAVLMAVGVTVVSVNAFDNNSPKGDKYETVSSSDGEVFPGYNNNLILKSDAYKETKVPDKLEIPRKVEVAKTPISKKVKVAEAPKVSKVAEIKKTPEDYKISRLFKRMDAFGREIAKHDAKIKTADISFTEEHGEKRVIGAEDYTRIEYVQNAIQFTKWNPETKSGVPPAIQEELRLILPGLCAQESKFNNGLISKAGAIGIMQFMPKTWEQYGGKPEEYKSLKRQVEIAGLFFSDLYKQLQHHIGDEALQKLRSRYDNDDSFQRDLMVPLMVNSYNTGSSRMAEAVKLYLNKTPVKKMPTGKELYLAIADYAVSPKEGEPLPGYGKDSREYVPKIYAQAKILNKSKNGDGGA